MAYYLQKLSKDQQWDLMKMVIDRGDMKMLFKMLQNGYEPTPAMIEALRFLHYGRELAVIADLYAERYGLWPVFEGIFGADKLNAFKKRREERRALKERRLLDKSIKEFNHELYKADQLTLGLIRQAYKIGRLKQLADYFGADKLYDMLQNEVGLDDAQLTFLEVFSDEFLIIRKNYICILRSLCPGSVKDSIQYCRKILGYEGGLAALVSVTDYTDSHKRFLTPWLIENAEGALDEFFAQKKWHELIAGGLLDFEAWKKWWSEDPRVALRYVTGNNAWKLSSGRFEMFRFLIRRRKFRDAFRAL